MSDRPNRLYKYLGPERIDALRSGMVRYSPLCAFNDPFEGRPEITGLTTDEEARQALREHLDKEAIGAYANLDPNLRAAMSLPQFLAIAKSFYETKESEVVAQMQAFAPTLEAIMQSKFEEHVGALCLSEIPDSLLMWSHYGASHSGFVVEFDVTHRHFDERRSEQDEFRCLRRVLYRETRPSAPLSGMSGAEMFLVKSGHWAYEREWRILRALREADVVTAGAPWPLHLFRFPREAVTAVILGARSSPSLAADVKEALRSEASLSGARLRRACPDKSQFLLRIVDEPI